MADAECWMKEKAIKSEEKHEKRQENALQKIKKQERRSFNLMRKGKEEIANKKGKKKGKEQKR